MSNAVWSYKIIVCETLDEAANILHREGLCRWRCIEFDAHHNNGILMVFEQEYEG